MRLLPVADALCEQISRNREFVSLCQDTERRLFRKMNSCTLSKPCSRLFKIQSASASVTAEGFPLPAIEPRQHRNSLKITPHTKMRRAVGIFKMISKSWVEPECSPPLKEMLRINPVRCQNRDFDLGILLLINNFAAYGFGTISWSRSAKFSAHQLKYHGIQYILSVRAK